MSQPRFATQEPLRTSQTRLASLVAAVDALKADADALNAMTSEERAHGRPAHDLDVAIHEKIRGLLSI